jgi:hypothetical protein
VPVRVLLKRLTVVRLADAPTGQASGRVPAGIANAVQMAQLETASGLLDSTDVSDGVCCVLLPRQLVLASSALQGSCLLARLGLPLEFFRVDA